MIAQKGDVFDVRANFGCAMHTNFVTGNDHILSFIKRECIRLGPPAGAFSSIQYIQLT